MTTAARCLFVALLSVTTAWAGGIPGAVSPGEAAETMIEASCPAFSWAGVPGADSYEILVYRVPALSALPAAAPALQQHVPGEARSWTPPVNRCLERGGRYAWILRARAAGVPSEWSEPALFRVSPAPSIASVERALDTLRAFIESEGSGVAAADPQLSSFASHVPRLLDSRQAVPSRSSSAPTPGSPFGPSEPFDELGLMAQAAAPGISASRAIGIYGYALGADGGAGVVGEAELDPLVGATGGDGVLGRSDHGSGVHGIGLCGSLRGRDLRRRAFRWADRLGSLREYLLQRRPPRELQRAPREHQKWAGRPRCPRSGTLQQGQPHARNELHRVLRL